MQCANCRGKGKVVIGHQRYDRSSRTRPLIDPCWACEGTGSVPDQEAKPAFDPDGLC